MCTIWLSQSNVDLLTTGSRHLDIALGVLEMLSTAGKLITGVQLAAYGIECCAEIHSNDTDFTQFTGLRWINPLHD